jgi:hypothetical protein
MSENNFMENKALNGGGLFLDESKLYSIFKTNESKIH